MELRDVHSQSKGRTPGVFVFNPFAEGYIAHGKGFTPVKSQALLAADLANLPQFLCRADDVVLLPKRPSVEFLSVIKQAGFPVPEFVELKEGRIELGCNLRQRKIASLRPWAWGPDSVELLEPLFANVTNDTRAPSECFNDGIARLYSKAWSAAFLRTVLAHVRAGDAAPRQATRASSVRFDTAVEPWLCPEMEVGVVVDTLDGALEAIAEIRRRGHHRVIAKEAHGLAGHNAIRLWEPEVLAAQRQWLARALQHGRQLVVEPWLERELDFSVQLEMSPEQLRVCGYTGLINDRKGQFQANWAEANYERRLPAHVAAVWRDATDVSGRLERLYAVIFSLLEAELQRVRYVGPVSIDSFVYRTAQGQFRLKPVVEINPRHTMGRLTVELMKQTRPGSCGIFRLVSRAQACAGGADFTGYARRWTEQFPLQLEGEPVPKIREGALCLTDPTQAQVCLATFHARRTLPPLLAGDACGP